MILYKVRDEITAEAKLGIREIKENNDMALYTLSEYEHDGRQWKVLFNKDEDKLQCSCKKYESDGIPCSHLISVMKAMNLREFKSCCIKRRWTKFAKPTSQ